MALFDHEIECVCSYTIWVVLAVIALAVSIGIGAYFAYNCMKHNTEIGANESFDYQTTLPC